MCVLILHSLFLLQIGAHVSKYAHYNHSMISLDVGKPELNRIRTAMRADGKSEHEIKICLQMRSTMKYRDNKRKQRCVKLAQAAAAAVSGSPDFQGVDVGDRPSSSGIEEDQAAHASK